MDQKTVRKVARLGRLALNDAQLDRMGVQITGILKWIDQLAEVNTDNVEPLANVANIELKLRADEVTDGGDAQKVLANAPEEMQGFYVVPKVVE
jgi:aspartyl-tRNA(Asn)/glutamyl-tRNA(Gln) amidotransferase subunit C